ncbi:MAG: recombinase family protein [Bacteroidales bacterium]|nr:recombinase family protein [Bacteroidales bacterium]
MSVFAYIRVSTQMQTYASQRYEIEMYCRNNKILVDEWINESVSGTIAVEKRILGSLLERMEKGDVLICTELSRLGRNMLMIMSVLNTCSGKGISIHSIKDHFDLTDNINSKIIAFAFALAAEIERNLISQRTKEALAVKKLEGVKLGRPPGSSKKKVTFCKDYDRILAMKSEGKSISFIAKAYGIHRNTLKRYLDDVKS